MSCHLDTINNNRSLASVDSNEVAGQDQNTQAYGNYVEAIEDNLNQNKFKETDKSTYNKARNELVPELNKLFDQLPHKAVDSRVGQVIDSPTTKKYKKTAKQKLDNALQSLAVAMKHQIDVLLPKR